MGQFYKGTPIDLIDNAMYELPFELMQTALKSKQKEYDTAKADAIKIADDLSILPYHIDREEAKTIKGRYETEIDSLVQKINGDKVNAHKYLPEVAALQKKLKLDTTSGDIYNVNKRNEEMMKVREGLKKQFETKPEEFGWTSLEEAYSQLDKNYATLGGYKDKETGNYNMTPSLELVGRMAMPKLIDEVITKKFGKDRTEKSGGPQGIFKKVMTEDRWEGFTADELKGSIVSNILGDEHKLKSYRQQLEFLGGDPTNEKMVQALINRDVENSMNYAKANYGKKHVFHSKDSTLTNAGEARDMEKYEQSKEPTTTSTSVGSNTPFLHPTQDSYVKAIAPVLNGAKDMLEDMRGMYMRSNPGKDASKLSAQDLIYNLFPDKESREQHLDRYQTATINSNAAASKLEWINQQKAKGIPWETIKKQRFTTFGQESVNNELPAGAIKAVSKVLSAKGTQIPIDVSGLDMKLKQTVRVERVSKSGKKHEWKDVELPIVFIAPTGNSYNINYNSIKDGERVKLKDTKKEVIVRKVSSLIMPVADLHKFGIQYFNDMSTKKTYTVDEKTGRAIEEGREVTSKSGKTLSINTDSPSVFALNSNRTKMPYMAITANIGQEQVTLQSPISRSVNNSIIPAGFDDLQRNLKPVTQLEQALNDNGGRVITDNKGTRLEGIAIPAHSIVRLGGTAWKIETDSDGYIHINGRKQLANDTNTKKLLRAYFAQE